MENALDNLEKRLDALDRILGPSQDASERKSGENFVDSLVVEELETFLNPDFKEDQQKLNRFAAYINSFSTDLQGTFSKLEEIKTLEPTLGAEYFRNIPGSSEELKKISDKNDEFKETQMLLEEQMLMSMKRFAEIEQGLVKDLALMNSRLDLVQEKIEKRQKDKAEN
uniref:Uncharacterized protein n=1 Tax=Megaselia scalaris TaxID=36166 RepID=T1GL68_MEGSC